MPEKGTRGWFPPPAWAGVRRHDGSCGSPRDSRRGRTGGGAGGRRSRRGASTRGGRVEGPAAGSLTGQAIVRARGEDTPLRGQSGGGRGPDRVGHATRLRDCGRIPSQRRGSKRRSIRCRDSVKARRSSGIVA